MEDENKSNDKPEGGSKSSKEEKTEEQIRRLNTELDEIKKFLSKDLDEKPLNIDNEIEYHRILATCCLGVAVLVIIAGGWGFWQADRITSSWNGGIEKYVQRKLDSLAKRDSINAQINIPIPAK